MHLLQASLYGVLWTADASPGHSYPNSDYCFLYASLAFEIPSSIQNNWQYCHRAPNVLSTYLVHDGLPSYCHEPRHKGLSQFTMDNVSQWPLLRQINIDFDTDLTTAAVNRET